MTGKVTSGVRKQRDMNAAAQLTLSSFKNFNLQPQSIGWGPYIQNGLLSSVSVNTFKDTLRLCFHSNSKSSQVDQEN